jgi:ribosomal protein S1
MNSELNKGQRDAIELGDEIKVRITDIDLERRRVLLSARL